MSLPTLISDVAAGGKFRLGRHVYKAFRRYDNVTTVATRHPDKDGEVFLVMQRGPAGSPFVVYKCDGTEGPLGPVLEQASEITLEDAPSRRT